MKSLITSFMSFQTCRGVKLRGPHFDPANSNDFIACLGAAQTLGVLAERPYPEILSESIGVPVWNAGVGGATPRFFLDHPRILELANRSRCVVLQVMAARSEKNDRLTPMKGAELVRDEKHGDVVTTNTAWARIQEEEPQNLQEYVAQSRAAWRENYHRLLQSITAPVILFWFSPKPLNAPIDLSKTSAFGQLDRFPHFVDGTDVDAIRSQAETFVTCFSNRGAGERLISRFTGQPVEIKPIMANAKFYSHGEAGRNLYYPSRDMHTDAAAALRQVVLKWGEPK